MNISVLAPASSFKESDPASTGMKAEMDPGPSEVLCGDFAEECRDFMKIHSIYCSRDSFYACSVKNVLFCFMSYCSCHFMDFVKKIQQEPVL